MVNKTIKRAYSGPLNILRSGYGDLRVIWGHLGTSLGGVDLRVILVNSEVNSGPYLDPYLRNLINTLI